MPSSTVQKWESSRPRLSFDPSRIRRLRRRVQKDGPVRDAWLETPARTDRLLEDELVPET